MQVLQPPGWTRPKGFSNGVLAEGRLVFIAGMVGADAAGRIVSDSFVGQARQALENVLAVLAEAGGKPKHICRMSWYVTDRQEYLANRAQVGAAYREVIGRHYPAMTLVEVSALVEDRAKLEIEASAVLPRG